MQRTLGPTLWEWMPAAVEMRLLAEDLAEQAGFHYFSDGVGRRWGRRWYASYWVFLEISSDVGASFRNWRKGK